MSGWYDHSFPHAELVRLLAILLCFSPFATFSFCPSIRCVKWLYELVKYTAYKTNLRESIKYQTPNLFDNIRYEGNSDNFPRNSIRTKGRSRARTCCPRRKLFVVTSGYPWTEEKREGCTAGWERRRIVALEKCERQPA